MELVLIVCLCAALLGMLPRGPGQAQLPQVLTLYVEPQPERRSAPGCLAWAFGALLLLVVLGVVRL